MNKEAPARCAAREEFSVEGVWGCCPIKRTGAPGRCSGFSFRGPESIACQYDAELGIIVVMLSKKNTEFVEKNANSAKSSVSKLGIILLK